jgi:integrase
MSDLLAGNIDILLQRIEKIANLDPVSSAVPAALGVIDLPDHTLFEMAARMPQLKMAEIRAKNPRQKREWSGNYTRAAKDFTSEIGTRTILSISEQDAIEYWEFWKKRARKDVTPNYANKQIRYVRQMIDAHYEDIRMPMSKRLNPFKGMSVKKLAYDPTDDERSKLPLPENWIKFSLVKDKILEDLNQEASDIAIVAAVCGCRASEIYDIPAEDIHLKAQIPHIKIRIVADGPEAREIKGSSSTREVVLLGAALDAMRRHPNGFTRYRGKAAYSSDVNNFLRNNSLFPKLPENSKERYVISGTRHSFEDRMKHAGIGNEERAFLMGHSIGKVRGRPVYGSTLALPLRALLQEMITFPTDTWEPRPRSILWKRIDELLEEEGHVLA